MIYFQCTAAGCFALSLRCKNKRFGVEIRHYKIRANDKGEFYIDAASNSKTFSNIVELVSYYTGRLNIMNRNCNTDVIYCRRGLQSTASILRLARYLTVAGSSQLSGLTVHNLWIR